MREMAGMVSQHFGDASKAQPDPIAEQNRVQGDEQTMKSRPRAGTGKRYGVYEVMLWWERVSSLQSSRAPARGQQNNNIIYKGTKGKFGNAFPDAII